ncbi:unnamed protein product [Bursaphelenchus xylophilus]|uniref:(pine wood nematode) hypothetical protein n=1 Tax=Bursaphelenchus xylophilus TaxID=6326 RepID=A0A1I7RZH2_BURXY|nr:unnamed protein product [Bursaphelenchus xylophilus]CAG9106389.1 unnamed protein product [Bursaphelenchus xylophilus]
MRTYKRFLINFTVMDFLFAFSLGILVKPYPIYPFQGAIIEGPLRYFENHGAVISTAFIINSAGYAMSTQCACIIYRFAILQADQRILEFVISWNTWIACYVATFFITAGTVFLANKMQVPQNEVYSKLLEVQPTYPGSVIPDISGKVVFLLNTGNEFTAIAAGLVFFGFFAAEVISIGCVYMILRILDSKKASFSKVTYRLHRQLTIALGIQLSTPFFFIILPVSIGIILVASNFRGGSHVVMELAILFIDLYGAVNSLITLYFVKPYRNFLVLKMKQFLFTITCGKVSSEPEPIVVAAMENTASVIG